MQTLRLNPSKIDSEAAISQFSRDRGLVAKWISVDGKLVCKWVLANSVDYPTGTAKRSHLTA